ncbi:MAG TPA: DNA topoisomerase IB [Thermomicrobiaceae bacterium]|nr:DNA topoisomerase IB [Thermomicrobiaceae bacterium]
MVRGGERPTGRGGSRPSRREVFAALADPEEAARAAGLHHVTDAMPGIRRISSGRGFRYLGPDGEQVREPKTIRRITSLAIPPAWTDVWICASPRGHIQATGRDARGRKQYRYHPRWREVRDATKYHRLVAFGEALPRIRQRTAHDLALSGLPREKVLATVVALLERTLIRVGNREYARQNRSFGLTTLRNRHVDVHGSTIRFHFRGKAGKEHEVDVRDRRLARIIQHCRELPGYELFQYVDEQGQRHSVDSSDVNDYLREITGQDFTAKDFRTWAGTVLAACALEHAGEPASQSEARHHVVEAVQEVASHLGNTPAISRRSYIHPGIIEDYQGGRLGSAWQDCADALAHVPAEGLDPEEATVLALLRRLSADEAGGERRAA